MTHFSYDPVSRLMTKIDFATSNKVQRSPYERLRTKDCQRGGLRPASKSADPNCAFRFEDSYEEEVFSCGYAFVCDGWLRHANRIVGAFHGAFRASAVDRRRLSGA